MKFISLQIIWLSANRNEPNVTLQMGVICWKLDIPNDLSICNNQGCVFLRVQLMIHLPWNFDTASENNISIISLPYSNQLRGILIDQREIWRHTYIKYPHLSPNYAFGITFEWLVCWSKVHVFWKGHKIQKKNSPVGRPWILFNQQ